MFKTLKLASFAGMAASVALTQLEVKSMFQPLAALEQPAATPRPPARSPVRNNPGSPTTNPSTQNPPGTVTPQSGTPANNPGTPTTNPSSGPSTLPGTTNQQPAGTNPANPTTNPATTGIPGTTGQQGTTGAAGAPGTGVNGTTTNNLAAQRLFALSNPAAEAQLTQAGQKLVRIEQQFTTANQQLLKQLGQARQLTGDRRSEAMGEIMQSMLLQQQQLQQYLVDLRTSVTGDLGTLDGTASAQQGANPVFDPGTTQNTRLNPGAPTTNSATPRFNTNPNTTNSVPGENRQNPSAPTTNPAGPGGGGNPGATGNTGTTGTTTPR